jgi:hypothetical protein
MVLTRQTREVAMDDPKHDYRYIGRDAGFWARAIAIAESSASPSSTTYVIESTAPIMSADRTRRMTHDAAPAPRFAVDPSFKMAFWGTIGLMVLCFVVWAGTAIFAPDTAATRGLIDGCETISKLGCGAVFGLIGGKATRTK